MFTGQRCRYYSLNTDAHIGRELGTQTIDHFILDRLYDAASPQQLEILACQFLYQARRCKTAGAREIAFKWKNAWRQANHMAEEARARLAKVPSYQQAPQLWNTRTVGKPGQLDADLRLPHNVEVDLNDLPSKSLSTGIYSAPLQHGRRYLVGPSRLGNTYLTLHGQNLPIPVSNNGLRGLLTLGRLIPVRQSSATHAA